MAGQLKLRRGTTSQLANYIGSEGELTYDTALKSLVLHDGVTLGGVKIPYLSNDLVPSTMLPTATESVIGASKIATTAIAQAGTNDTDIITPLKLKNTIFGFGQNRKVVAKISGTTYTNTTGKPIGFEVIFKSTGSGSVIMDSNITVNLEIRRRSVMLVGNTDYRCSMFVIILPNESYSFNAVNVSSIEKVTEIS